MGGSWHGAIGQPRMVGAVAIGHLQRMGGSWCHRAAARGGSCCHPAATYGGNCRHRAAAHGGRRCHRAPTAHGWKRHPNQPRTPIRTLATAGSSPHLRRQAAGRRPHAVGLEHPEGVHMPCSISSPRAARTSASLATPPRNGACALTSRSAREPKHV